MISVTSTTAATCSGRAKDLIIRSGHNIDPAIIEHCAEQHPAVALAAAVGRPDAYAGELPVVYVQLHPGHEVDAATLQTFIAGRIAEPPANPKTVTILAELPLTAVGKIHKPSLRALAAESVLLERLREGFPDATLTARGQQSAAGGLEVTLTAPAELAAAVATAATELGAQLNLRVTTEVLD